MWEEIFPCYYMQSDVCNKCEFPTTIYCATRRERVTAHTPKILLTTKVKTPRVSIVTLCLGSIRRPGKTVTPV